MNKETYKKLVKKHEPKPQRLKNSFLAFLVGGFIGLAAEILNRFLQNNFNLPINESMSWVIILFILIAVVLTVTHLFDDIASWARAGVIIPITGFAHGITSAAMDYKTDGMITGLGANFFKIAGCVLLYGISSAFILALLKVMLYG